MMLRTLKTYLPSLLTVMLMMSGLVLYPSITHVPQLATKRTPSSSQSSGILNCFEASLPLINPSERSRFFFFKRNRNWNREYYLRYKDWFQVNPEIEVASIDRNPESLAAYFDHLLEADGMSLGVKISQMSSGQQKKVLGMLEKMAKGERYYLSDLRDMVATIYETSFLDKHNWRLLGMKEVQKQEWLMQMYAEEVVNIGLTKVIAKFTQEKDQPKFWDQFINSQLMNGFLSLGLNIGMFTGNWWAPLYLPRMKRFRLSRELAERLFREGPSRENLELMEVELGMGVGVKTVVQYEVFRRYYIWASATVFSLYLLYEDYQTGQALDEQREIIEQMQGIGSQLTGELDELQDNGFDESRVTEILEDRECFDYKLCLDSIDQSDQVQLSECATYFDPSGACSNGE